MTFTPVLQTVVATPLFASRPFLAAFGVAAFARWTEWIHGPEWFTHDVTLWVLGILGALEILARKDVDIRNFLEEFDQVVKAAVAVMVNLVLLDPESLALLETMTASLVPGFAWIWASVVGSLTWILAIFRKATLRVLEEIDEDDTLGIQGVISWLEDLGVAGGVVLVVILPLVALAVFGLTLLGLYLFRRAMERREERSKIPCSHCKQPTHPSAFSCPSCGGANPKPVQVGWFGEPRVQPVTDPAEHRIRLISRRRCPVCVTKLTQRTIRQACPACGTETFDSAAAVNDYLAALQARLPKTALICFGLGFIPVLGIIPGVIYYRLSLLSGLRAYVPRSTGCLARWGVRLLNLVLIALQWIPGFGAVMLPAMCASNFYIYRSVVAREGPKAERPAQPLATPAAPASG